MKTQARVQQAVQAVCPIDGISFGKLSDPSTWLIHFKPEATAQQQADAVTVITNYVDNPTSEEVRCQAITDTIIADTTIAALKAMTVAEFDTWWAANVTTLAQANNVLKRLARVVIHRVL